MMVGGIFSILLVIVVVWGIIQFAGKGNLNTLFPSGYRKPPAEGENALDILKKRYARGEITREQFERMKKELT